MSGKVIWITGLAGAGKSTIGGGVYGELKRRHANSVYLDGDDMRGVLGSRVGYTPAERLELGLTYGRLCCLLSRQEIHVVMATISMFRDVYEWNRANLADYCEVYIKASYETLRRRDPKGLYSVVRRDVVGVDTVYDEPPRPDVVIDNDDGSMIDVHVERVLRQAGVLPPAGSLAVERR